MKLLFDANISYRIVKKLKIHFPDCLHVSKSGLTFPITDRKIWQFALQNDFIIVTYDEDFYELSNLYNSPPKVIWLRFGNLPLNTIVERLVGFKKNIETLHADSQMALLEIF